MDARVLAAVGVDAELPAAQAAAVLVRRLPLRWRPADGARDPDSVVESRWFAGASECARVLGRLFRGTTVRGSAFGVPWPVLQAAGVVVAPALPAAAEGDEQQGPDGVYQLLEGIVWREAIGERRRFMTLSAGQQPEDMEGFDLLWYGASERYLLRGGTLEVEDLFSRLTVSATRPLVERLLLRGLRVEQGAIEGVAFSEREAPPEVQVRRPTALVGGDVWRDPVAVLERRADILRVERRGDEIVAETGRDTTVVFRLVEEGRGWRAFAWDGHYPLRALELVEHDEHLRFSATLEPDLDPFTPGLRGRLAFDLRSDLVALGKGEVEK